MRSGKFTQFAADNLDELEETRGGKNTFHVTNVACFQSRSDDDPDPVVPVVSIGREKTLKDVPPGYSEIEDCRDPEHPDPHFGKPAKSEWFDKFGPESSKAETADMEWCMQRAGETDVKSWTEHNKGDTVHSDTMEIGYLPMIRKPAHEYSTIKAVIDRCIVISRKLKQKYTVITLDEGLYYRAKQVVWKWYAGKNVILRLGSFHVILNFLKCIGKYHENNGLEDIAVIKDIFGKNTAKHVFDGHHYNRSVRTVKLLYESTWRHLLSVANITNCSAQEARKKIQMLDRQKKIENDLNYLYLRSCMNMYGIMLRFLRAEREGNWTLHLESFSQMLPWFAAYGHTNYTRWGAVYLDEMRKLQTDAPEVYRQFMAGNFVMRRSRGNFNKIAFDQALEYVNKVCKIAGGIIGITKNETALDRWAIGFNVRAQLVDSARRMFGLIQDDNYMDAERRKEGNQRARNKQDIDLEEVEKMISGLQLFRAFQTPSNEIIKISTSEMAGSSITNFLSTVHEMGKTIINRFVSDRLGSSENVISIYDKLSSPHQETLKDIVQPRSIAMNRGSKRKPNDIDIYRACHEAHASGREIDMRELAAFECTDLPPSLSDIMTGNLRTGQKSDLAKILIGDHSVTEMPKSSTPHLTIIDGMALLRSVGRRSFSNWRTWAEAISSIIQSQFNSSCGRVDIVFDSYDGPRLKSRSDKETIKRNSVIGDHLLPTDMSGFFNSAHNKKLIQKYVVDILMANHDNKVGELIVAGGKEDATSTHSTLRGDMTSLKSSQQEADTRLILHLEHASREGYVRAKISARDTDILVLLLHHAKRLPSEIWLDWSSDIKSRETESD